MIAMTTLRYHLGGIGKVTDRVYFAESLTLNDSSLIPRLLPCTRQQKIRGQRAWYAFARDTRHVDVTAIINLSVTSQLERADFCGSNRST